MPFPSDVIELSSDSDDEPRPSLPPSSQQSFTPGQVVYISDSDDDLPAPGHPAFSQPLSLKAAGKRKRHSSSRSSSPSVAPEAYRAESSDEDEESPRKVSRKSNTGKGKAPRNPRKTEEEKAAAKVQKQKDAADKKAQKAAEKADKAAQTAREKAAKKEYLAANKLVIDKKTTLAKMEIVFPPALRHSALLPAFRAHIAQYNMAVSIAPENIVRGYDVFYWNRTVAAEYDPVAREWQPLPGAPRVDELPTYLVYMGADQLARCIKDEDGVKNVVRVVRAAGGGPKTQVFLMVEGLKLYFKRKTGIRYTKSEIQRALAALQIAENTHILYVDTVEDAVARLYDLSADLGIKPYKLIQRSHLPFCSDIQQPTGTTFADTWVKMLGQVHRMTEHGARGIAAPRAFPTANALFEAYRTAPDARARDGLVMHCKISHRADGAAKERPVGAALAQVVGTVMYGTDPLQLAYKAAKSGEREEE
ncbi:hypothetical protein B0H14DRAFT_3893716 [Mycena olivaceomarginata]|nr:hypothetical protein B0H14DRAFT_3893716 [Mycena olivaceomarginata]